MGIVLTNLVALALPLISGATFHSLNDHVLPADKSDFSFVVIGDNRPAGAGLPPTATYRRLMGDIAMIGPDFVISSGDLIYGNEESLDRYKEECREIKPIIDSLPCPFFNAPGNHELAERQEFQDTYENIFGALRGAFTFGGCRFIAVCSDYVGHPNSIPAEEGTWLDKELEAPGPKVVYFHHPIYGRKSNAEGAHVLADGAAWHQKFVANHVSQVFEGHDHVLNHQTHDGVEYWISGGGGAPLDTTPDAGGYHHFLVVNVKSGKFSVAIIPEGALEIDRSNPSSVKVANYCDEDLPLTNLKMKLDSATVKLKAYSDSKGKHTPVDALVKSYDPVTKMATVSVTAGKHHLTVIER